MRSRIRRLVRGLRSAPVLGAGIRALDRVWWARTVLASALIDAQYYSALLGHRVGRRAAVAHYVTRGFRRGMSLNPLFDEVYAGAELPEVLRVPALYAYLVSERATVSVHPWWDATRHDPGDGAVAGEGDPPLERLWRDPSGSLVLRTAAAETTMSVDQYRRLAIEAARTWRRGAAPTGGPVPHHEVGLVRILQAGDRRYHRKLAQAAHRATDGSAAAVVSFVAPDASAWVSAMILRQLVPSLVVRREAATSTWSRVVGAALSSLAADTLIVLDARAEFSEGELDRLAREASAGSFVIPAHRRFDGTVAGIGAATIGRGIPGRILEWMPPEDLDGLDAVLDVPLLTGRTFAVARATLDRAGALPSLTNDGELEAISIDVRRRCADVPLRVLTDVRPVFDEPEIAFRRRRAGRDARYWRRRSGVDDTPVARSIIGAAGFDVRGWRHRRPSVRPSADLVWRRPHPGAQRWSIKICAPAGRQGAVWGDRHFAEGLARALRRRGHTVVIDAFDAASRPTDAVDDVSVVVRGPYRIRAPRTRVRLQWIISHPDEITRAEVSGFDRVFAASKGWAARASARWGRDIRPLLECVDTDLFHPRGLPRGDDIVFVGTARGIARPSVVVPLAAGIPVRVYGPDWRPFIAQSALAARSIPHDRLPDRYETASIVLNDQWPAMRREGFLAMRPFDVVAVGGRVISEEVEGIEEIFEGAVVTYQDAAHLVDLLRADPATIFPDDAQLARISARIRAEHSFDARARELDEAAREVWTSAGEPGVPGPSR